MEPPIAGHDAISREESAVHTWRVSQLRRLGLPGLLAEIYADRIDWHQVARLVQRGWPLQMPRETGTHQAAVRRPGQDDQVRQHHRLSGTRAVRRLFHLRDLHAHRGAIAALLAPRFSRRTVADLAAAFAGTSVPWGVGTTSPGPS